MQVTTTGTFECHRYIKDHTSYSLYNTTFITPANKTRASTSFADDKWSEIHLHLHSNTHARTHPCTPTRHTLSWYRLAINQQFLSRGKADCIHTIPPLFFLSSSKDAFAQIHNKHDD